MRLSKYIPKGDRRKDVRALPRKQAAARLAPTQGHAPHHHAILLYAFLNQNAVLATVARRTAP